MRKIIVCSLSLVVLSCGASITSNFTSRLQPITIEQKVVILDIKHIVPLTAKKIGYASFGDTGFSTNCDYNSNLASAREIARKNGANLVKVTEKKDPTFFGSTCYRIKVDFYSYTGDTNQLDQYQIQIN